MRYSLILLTSLVSACSPVRHTEQSNKLTAGIVQREIRIGMPASDVATILGSPNIVSLDENKDEVWVYDKISTQVEYNQSAAGLWLLVIGAQKESGYSSRSQKTLTIVIKFDTNKQVKDFTYHASSF